MPNAAAVPLVGPLTSPPMLIGILLAALLVIVVGRVLLSVAWRVVVLALGLVVALWALGAVGLGPL